MINDIDKINDIDNVDELVDLLDNMVAQGTGRINIVTNEETDEVSVTTINSTDCGKTGACCQPTEIDL